MKEMRYAMVLKNNFLKKDPIILGRNVEISFSIVIFTILFFFHLLDAWSIRIMVVKFTRMVENGGFPSNRILLIRRQ